MFPDEVLNRLITECRASVTELKHAYRVNGLFDLFKGSSTIYDNVNKKYVKSLTDDERFLWCQRMISIHPSKDAFQKLDTGRISYQEFKHNLHVNRVEDVNVNSADYHWNQNKGVECEEDLYFLIHNDDLKIGKSGDVRKRMKQLSTGLSSGYGCYVFRGKGFLEKKLHMCFSKYRKRGEWFEYSDEIKRWIKRTYNRINGYWINGMTKSKRA